MKISRPKLVISASMHTIICAASYEWRISAILLISDARASELTNIYDGFVRGQVAWAIYGVLLYTPILIIIAQ